MAVCDALGEDALSGGAVRCAALPPLGGRRTRQALGPGGLEGEGTAQEAAKKLAMHVVAARPQYLDPSAVPDDMVQKEKEILTETEKLRGSDKPPEILEIVAGQLRKLYEGVCLTEQAHMGGGQPQGWEGVKGSGLEAKGFWLMGMDKAS